MLRLLRGGGEGVLVAFTQACWRRKKIGPDWADSAMAATPKPGKEMRYACSWRPISLATICHGAISQLPAKRMEQHSELMAGENQGGGFAHGGESQARS